MPLNIGNSFNANFKETIPADGRVVVVNVSGSFFLCKSAQYRFEMSVDGGEWFALDAGFSFPLPEGYFERLSFRNPSGDDAAPEANEIEFYAGSVQLRDSRFTIIRDQTIGANIPVANAPTTTKGTGLLGLASGAFSAVFTGSNAGKARKQFVCHNFDAAGNLYVLDGANVVLGVVGPLQSWTLETNGTLRIFNPTAGAVNYVVGETFYA